MLQNFKFLAYNATEKLGTNLLKAPSLITGLGGYFIFMKNTVLGFIRPKLQFRLVVQYMEFVGYQSWIIIALSGAMMGAIFGFQLGYIFRIFGTETLIGSASAIALSRELAPVYGAFLVTARAGSAMAAEIATMRVNEQIDALEVMTVNPVNYLVAPRVLASIIMMPALCALFVFCGVTASFIVAVLSLNVDVAVFFNKITWICRPSDLYMGMQKAAIFGALFSSVACYTGYKASGGAEGVGRATTKAVVISLVLTLVVDFLLSIFVFKPDGNILF